MSANVKLSQYMFEALGQLANHSRLTAATATLNALVRRGLATKADHGLYTRWEITHAGSSRWANEVIRRGCATK